MDQSPFRLLGGEGFEDLTKLDRIWAYSMQSANYLRISHHDKRSYGLIDLLEMGLWDWTDKRDGPVQKPARRAMRHASAIGTHLWILLKEVQYKVGGY